ncbi:MAG TPA: hypothetical protein V6C85_26340 [Allocoleopsis sp.]
MSLMVAIAPRPESAYQRLLVRTIGLELEQKRQDEEKVSASSCPLPIFNFSQAARPHIGVISSTVGVLCDRYPDPNRAMTKD